MERPGDQRALPTPGCCSASRRSSTPRSRPASCSAGCTWPTGGCCGSRATASSGRHAGVLEDYGCVAGVSSSLRPATGDPVWLDARRAAARRRAGAIRRRRRRLPRHRRRRRGAGRAAARPGRQRLAVGAVLDGARAGDRAALTGAGRYRDAAEAALATVAVLAERAPRFAGWSLAAAEAMLDGPLEIAVVGPAGADRDALALARPTAAGCGRRDGGRSARRHAAARGSGPSTDAPAAYVCRRFVCERPADRPRRCTRLLAFNPSLRLRGLDDAR